MQFSKTGSRFRSSRLRTTQTKTPTAASNTQSGKPPKRIGGGQAPETSSTTANDAFVSTSSSSKTRKLTSGVDNLSGGQARLRRRGTACSQVGVEKLKAKEGGVFGFMRSIKRGTSAALLGLVLMTTLAPGCASAQTAYASPMPQTAITQQVEAHDASAMSLMDLRLTGADTAQEVSVADGLDNVVDGLTPTSLSIGDPLTLLDGIDDGKVRIDIPMQEGVYDGAGKVKVKPGTVLRLQVEIQDGRLVPADNGDGTFASFSQPLDAALWVDAHGIYLKDTKGGQGKLVADLSGFFDQSVTDAGSLQLGDFVRSLLDGAGDDGGSSSSRSAANANHNGRPPLLQAFQFQDLTFATSDITFAPGPLDLGGVQVSIDDDTQFRMSGTGAQATLTGQVHLDGGALEQGGAVVGLGNVDGTLQLTMEKTDDGKRLISGSVTDIDTRVHQLTLGANGDDDKQHVQLRNVRVQNADVSFSSEVDLAGGMQVTPTGVAFSGDISGQLVDAQLVTPDADGTAGIAGSAKSFSGSVDVDDNGVRLQGQVQGAQLTVTDLDVGDKEDGVRLSSGKLQGDGALSVAKDGAVDLQLNARSVDIQLDDVRTTSSSTDLDLGKTSITGSGQVRYASGIDANDGLQLTGDLRVDGLIDDLQVRNADAPGDDGVVLDVRANTTIDGTVRQLVVPSDGPIALDANVHVDGGVDRLNIDGHSVQASGSGTLSGSAQLLLRGGQLDLNQSSLRAHLTVDDAQITPTNSGVDLDVAHGAQMVLQLEQLSMNGSDVASLSLGKGSALSGHLDRGTLDVGGQTVQLDGSSRVHFSVDDVVHDGTSDDAGTTLKGRLVVDVGAQTQLPASLTAGLSGDAGAQGRLVIDDVQLRSDGTFALNDVNLSLDAQLGGITGATGDDAAPQSTSPTALRDVLDRAPHVQTNQDLINLLYAQHGGSYDGAAQGARQLGVSMSDLLQDRTADVHDLLPANLDVASLDLPSAQDIQQMSAADLIGLSSLNKTAAINPMAIADVVQDGTLKVTIPVSGTVGDGSWLGSADFPAGTTLTLEASVEDGKLDADSVKLKFSSSGDGPLWVTVKGAYLDDDNTLRLDLGGMKDFAVDGMENLPTDLSSLVQRFTSASSSNSSGTSTSGISFGDAHVQLSDLTLSGALQLPSGLLHVDDDTQLNFSGTRHSGQLSGDIHLNGASFDGGDVAVDNARGQTSLHMNYELSSTGYTSVLTLRNTDLDVDALGYRTDAGDFVHLTDATAEGTLQFAATAPVDTDGVPAAVPNVVADAQLTDVSGSLHGARLTLPTSDGGPQQVELGPSSFSGSLVVDDNVVQQLGGRVDNLVAQLAGGDLQLNSLTGSSGLQSVRVDDARLMGSGTLSYDGGELSVSDANVALQAHLSSDTAASDDGPVRIVNARAQLHVQLDDLQRLHLDDNGQVHLDADGAQAGLRMQAQSILGTWWTPPNP